MGYTLPLEQIPLDDYRQLLRQQNLLPGRRILLEQLDARFSLFADLGFATVAQLKAGLATPQKLAALAAKTGIPEEYLVILRRELGSLTQNPVSLAEFPGCDPALIASTTDYAGEFASSISQGRTFAGQFHPERSQEAGLGLIRNFLEAEM